MCSSILQGAAAAKSTENSLRCTPLNIGIGHEVMPHVIS